MHKHICWTYWSPSGEEASSRNAKKKSQCTIELLNDAEQCWAARVPGSAENAWTCPAGPSKAHSCRVGPPVTQATTCTPTRLCTARWTRLLASERKRRGISSTANPLFGCTADKTSFKAACALSALDSLVNDTDRETQRRDPGPFTNRRPKIEAKQPRTPRDLPWRDLRGAPTLRLVEAQADSGKGGAIAQGRAARTTRAAMSRSLKGGSNYPERTSIQNIHVYSLQFTYICLHQFTA